MQASMDTFRTSATSSQGSPRSSFYSSLDENGCTSETSPEGSQKDITEPTLKDPDGLLDLAVFGISSCPMPGGSSGTKFVKATVLLEDQTSSDPHIGQKNLLDLTPFGVMNGLLKRQTDSAAGTGNTLSGGGRPQGAKVQMRTYQTTTPSRKVVGEPVSSGRQENLRRATSRNHDHRIKLWVESTPTPNN